ncbi:RNase adapter RapZ [Rickettsiales bacterium]|nr:RNase adapter RapZ [Rickettsiales bacterium]
MIDKKKVVILTGLSGAGRSTALKIFEDLGYDAVDNLPSSLIPLLLNKELKGYIAMGIDVRSREFNGKRIAGFINKNKKNMKIELVFLDCDTDILINRFKESRRPHPLRLDIPIADIIKQERLWLDPLKKVADHKFDTSALTVPNLGKLLNLKLNLRILSFGYKYGVPRESDIIIDMRFIKNPYYVKNLKKLTGKDMKVIKYIEKQKPFIDFFEEFLNLQKKILPMFFSEGKKFLTIAFGCTGGIHRSVMTANRFYESIVSEDLKAFVEHRDLKK